MGSALPRCLLLWAALISLAAPAAARERILDFNSEITVREDASLRVTERIIVRAEGQEIKRGIRRDFPTSYKDRMGNNVRVGFRVVSVTKNGLSEPYHLRPERNGESVYIGDKSVYLPADEFVYELVYETNRQLGFFPTHDELYWNVTGNGWSFPIDRARASVLLPAGAEPISHEGYTGPQGARGRNFRARREDGATVFETSAPLGPGEGLTIVVSWPKGHVREPDARARAAWFLEDNRGAASGLVALGLLFLYYLLVWRLVGKDPEPNSIVPEFQPPAGISPAAARYISLMGYDDKAFAAALINMAVSGYLRLDEEKGTYTVEKNPAGSAGALSTEERSAAQRLLAGGRVALTQNNHGVIGKAVKELKDSLQAQFEKIYFITNRGYFLLGLALTAVLLGHNGLRWARQPEGFLFMSVWLTGWTFGVLMLVRQTLAQWKMVLLGQGLSHVASAIFMTLFSVPFLGGECAGLFMLSRAGYPLMPFLLLAMVLVNYLFYDWLKAPTLAGRRVLDRIEGFKMFLAAAEKDRLNALYPGERTPALFERYLPYALALGVEQQWAEKFSGQLAQAQAGAGQMGGYRPAWYSGSNFGRVGAGGFATALGASVAGAISASSTAPGSSSGGGGGGSSGGGGGGGGGGGW